MAALDESSPPRSSVLAEAERLARTDVRKSRGLLEQALHASGGPLIEQHDDLYTATFVAVGPEQPPTVRCPLFLNEDWQQAMRPLAGVPQVWWAEGSTGHSDIRTQYRFLPHSIKARDFPMADERASLIAALRAVYQLGYPDPFNRDREYPSSAVGMTSRAPYDKWDSVVAFPEATEPTAHSLSAREATVTRFELQSSRLGNTRTITLWQPPDADLSEPLPVVVLLDGEDMLNAIDAPGIVSAITRDHRPIRVALVHNATEVSRHTEYPCNPIFADFVAEDLWPALRHEIAVPSRSEDRLVGGFSYGGLAALWLALSRPDLFGGVVALSPSMWWAPDLQPRTSFEQDAPAAGGGEWLTSLYAASDRAPLRIWMSVGLLETRRLSFAPHLDMLACCRRFRSVLENKGYELAGYVEHPSAHEFLGWRSCLADGLRALLVPVNS